MRQHKEILNGSNLLIHCKTVSIFFSKSVLQGAKLVWGEKKHRPFFPLSVNTLTLDQKPLTAHAGFLNVGKKTRAVLQYKILSPEVQEPF